MTDRLRRAVLGAALALFVSLAGVARALDQALYAQLLQRHTQAVADLAGTRVDYRALRGTPGASGSPGSPEWRRLIASLEQSAPSKLTTREEKLAFWINAYNILAIDTVLRGYPLDSIRDLGNFVFPVWGKPAGRIEGREVTLEEIEHEILRPMGEPRIHFAIVCASLSCPSLRREPWEASRLDAQLEDATRAFVADPRKGLRIEANGTVRVSSIFKWFSGDFEAAGGVLAFVAPRVSDAQRPRLEGADLAYLDYDWRLNDTATAP